MLLGGGEAVVVTAVGGGASALKLARLLRNLTLEEAAAALNAITGGATDASLLSAWESGRRRTGTRNRAGVCGLYREHSQVLFSHQDGKHQRAGDRGDGGGEWSGCSWSTTGCCTGRRGTGY